MSGHERKLVDASYVADALGVSRAGAYRIIRELNQELEASSIRTLPGKVSLSYLEHRFFSLPEKEVGNNGSES